MGDYFNFNRENYFGNGYFSNYFTSQSSLPIEAKIKSLEKQLDKRGVDVPEQTSRGFLDRVIDAVSITSYPILGAIRNKIDNNPNTTAGQGFIEGVKASNPFGKGYEQGEVTGTDVLQASGWKAQDNPDGRWYNPLSWNGNNVARNVTGFVGGVLLDPATYLSGGAKPLLQGAGRGIVRNSAKSAEREIAKQAFTTSMEKLANGGAEQILKDFGQDASKEMVEGILNKVKRDSKYFNEESALKWGIGKNKVTLVSDATLRKIGDATIAPYFNTLKNTLNENQFTSRVLNKLGNLFTSKETLLSRKAAQENPELYTKTLALKQYSKDMFKTFNEVQSGFRQHSAELFKNLSEDSQRAMTDLLETKGAFKDVSYLVTSLEPTIAKTDEAQKLFDDLAKLRDETSQIIANFKELGIHAETLEAYKKLNRNISQLMRNNSFDYNSLINKDSIKHADNLKELSPELLNKTLNDMINDDVATIQTKLEQQGYKNSDRLAVELRAILDKAQSTIDPSVRKYLTGQKYFSKIANTADEQMSGDVRAFNDSELNDLDKTKFAQKKLNMQERKDMILKMARDLVVKKGVPQEAFGAELKQAFSQLSKMSDEELQINYTKLYKMSDSELAKYDNVKSIDDVRYEKDRSNFLSDLESKRMPEGKEYAGNMADDLEANNKGKYFNDANNKSFQKMKEHVWTVLQKQGLTIDEATKVVNSKTFSQVTWDNKDSFINFILKRRQESGLAKEEISATSMLKGVQKIDPELRMIAYQKLTRAGFDKSEVEQLVNSPFVMKNFTKEDIEEKLDKIIANSQKPNKFTDSDVNMDFAKLKEGDGKYFKYTDEKVPHNEFNIRGTKVAEEAGSPQNVKVEMIKDALDKIAKVNPKLSNFLRQITVKLPNTDSLVEGIINMRRSVTENKRIGVNDVIVPNSKADDIAGRIKDRVLPHEVGHALGKDMGMFLYKDNEWLDVIKKDSNKIFKNAKFENYKLAEEDFAESFAKYIDNPAKFKAEFPTRFAAINKAIQEFVVPKNLLAGETNEAANYFKFPKTAKQSVKEMIERKKAVQEDLINKVSESKLTEEEAIAKFDELNKTLENEGNNELFNKLFTKEHGNKPKERMFFEEIEQKVKELDTDKIDMKKFGNEADEVKRVSEMVKEHFKNWGVEEGLDENMIEDYVTHFLREKLDEKDITKAKEAGVNIRTSFENVFARNRKYKGTISELNKKLKEVTGKDNVFETLLSRIYLNRGLAHNQLVFTKRYYNKVVEQFGQIIDDPTHVGVKEIFASTEDIKKILSHFDDSKILEKLGIKADENLTMKETIKKIGLPEEIMTTTKPITKINLDTFARLKGRSQEFKAFTMPELVAENLNNIGQIQAEEYKSTILNLYDKFLQTWKVNATSANLGFHGGNFISNQFQNYLAVGQDTLNPKLWYYAGKILSNDEKYLKNTRMSIKGKDYTLFEIKEMAKKLDAFADARFIDEQKGIVSDKSNMFDNITKGVNDAGIKIRTDEGKFDKNILNPLSKVVDVNNPLESLTAKHGAKNDFIGYQIGTSVGNKVENHARIINFLANLKQGKDFYEAADNVKKFLFDYSDLSAFEQNVLKRAIPFYTWMRKNIPLQLEQIATQPSTYSNVNKFMNTAEDAVPEDERLTPEEKNQFAREWIQLPGKVSVKDKKGKEHQEPIFINPRLPISDLNKITASPQDAIVNVLSSMSPVVKIPIELGMNKNMYFDSAISRGIGDKREAPGYMQIPNMIESALTGEKYKPTEISPQARYVLQNITSLENLSKIINASGEAKEGQLSDKTLALLNALLGLKTYSYDVDTYKKWAYRDRLKQLRDLKKKYDAEHKNED